MTLNHSKRGCLLLLGTTYNSIMINKNNNSYDTCSSASSASFSSFSSSCDYCQQTFVCIPATKRWQLSASAYDAPPPPTNQPVMAK